MDKSEFIGFYKLLIASNSYAPSNIGHAIISSYIEDEGNDYHKAHSTEFISIISMLPRYYEYYLKWALDYYVNKYSLVIITQEDPNAIHSTKVITIY